MAEHPIMSQSKPNGFLTAWRMIGAGSLLFSVLLHVGLLLIAGLIVIQLRLLLNWKWREFQSSRFASP